MVLYWEPRLERQVAGEVATVYLRGHRGDSGP